MEPRATPWEGRTFVYTHLRCLGDVAVFLQMHSQGAHLVYEVLDRRRTGPGPVTAGACAHDGGDRATGRL